MRRTITLAIAALAFAAAPLAATTSAPAAELSVNSGGIAFGYNDGYWDRGHQWHKWRNRKEASEWREHNAQHYFDRRHDAEREQGWRGDDRWWDHDNNRR